MKNLRHRGSQFLIATVETYDKKFQFLVRESGNFLFLGCLYTQFWTRNPNFRSKLSNSGVQRPKIGKTNFSKLRVSISYRMISYRMSPPYSVTFSRNFGGRFCGCSRLRRGSMIRKAPFSPRVWKFLKFRGTAYENIRWRHKIRNYIFLCQSPGISYFFGQNSGFQTCPAGYVYSFS